MKRFVVACACALAAVFASPALGAPRFGVAEDATKYAVDGGASLFAKLPDLGMTENRITVRWNANDPGTIQEQPFLDRSLPVAQRAGVRIVISVIPTEASAITSDPDVRIALFTAYLQKLARTYPYVTTFIVANEPNEAYFWQPQLGSDGSQLSGTAYERLLAASYDALKSVNPSIAVVAAGPSGDGNDTTSTSPVRFVKALGDAYRASGRTAPLMDQLAFHVYPAANADPPAKARDWPSVGPADLDRLKQAVWDAFSGTAQPTFGEFVVSTGLTLMVDEMGWQAAPDAAHAGAYYGTENVAVIGEEDQAQMYAQAVAQLSCDPVVSDAMIFHLVDEADLARFQSGLLRPDGSQRPAYAAVRSAIGQAGSCSAPHAWTHATGVIGASATFPSGNVPARQAVFGLSVTAAEDALGKAGIFRLRTAKDRVGVDELSRALAVAKTPRSPVRSDAKLVKAGWSPRFQFRGRLKPGWYVFAVRLTAAMNAARSQTIVSAAFRVGRPAKRS